MPVPKKMLLLISLTLLLGACAELNPLSESSVHAEAESRFSIVLGPVSSVDDATAKRMAEAHCAKQGEVARLPRMVGPSSVHYQCLD